VYEMVGIVCCRAARHRLASRVRGSVMVIAVGTGEGRRVAFDPPLEAKYMSIDGTFCGDCVVLNTGEDGGLIEHIPPTFIEFFLIFASAPRPVFRRCRRAWVHDTRMAVEYQRKGFGLASRVGRQ
jgi:hypothetical protein